MEPLRSAANQAETFEHAMSRVKSLTQSENIKRGDFARVQEEMTELEAQARHLGATTQFTMLDAAQAQGFLGMAGWSKDQIVRAMPGLLDLAAASGMDLARTSDIVSDNLTALGMTADQVGHMTDVYAYALTRSNLNMEALGESMKYAAPAMHAYGGDIHDAAAAMMIMGNAGIKGSMAGTALRMGLLRLAGPPKKASKEMESLGVSLSDATRMAYESQAQLEALGIHVDSGMKPTEKMSYVLRELSTKMEGLSKDEKLAAVGAIFGVNAASGWLAVLEQGPEKFEEFRNALRESDGTAQQIAGTMNDDTRGAWLYLSSALDALTTNVGSAFLPALRSMYEGLNPVVTELGDWIGRNPGVIRGLGLIAGAISAAMVGLAGFRLVLAGLNFAKTTLELMKATSAFRALGLGAAASGGLLSTLGGALRGIGVAMLAAGRAMMFTPWGLALTGLSVAALGVYKNWDKVGPYFERLWNGIKNGASGLSDALSGIMDRSGLSAGIDRLLEKLGLIEEKRKALTSQGDVRSEMDEAIRVEQEMSSTELEDLQRQTRTRLRSVSGSSDEEIGDALAEMTREAKQTTATQEQMRKMWHEELSRRTELTEERRTAIEGREDVSGSILRRLEEGAANQDVRNEANRSAYLSIAKERLQADGRLAGHEVTTILARLSESLETRAGVEQFGSELSKLRMPSSTLAEQDALMAAMLKMSAGSELDLTSKITAMEQHVTGLKLGERATATMLTALREGLQATTDAALGAEVLLQAIEDIESGAASRTPQNHALAVYAPMLSRNDSPIDWTRPARMIDCQVRGLIPWPCAEMVLPIAGTVKIWACEETGEKYNNITPGKFISADKKGLKIVCGDGNILLVKEIQAKGGKKMPFADWYRGHPFEI